MSKGKCDDPDCNAAITGKCHIGNDTPADCSQWKDEIKTTKSVKRTSTEQRLHIPWTGNNFKIADIERVSRRTSPYILGTVGHSDSGKTSFLGVLFTLLTNGHNLDDFRFSGSETFLQWEFLMRKLKFEKGKVAFPPPTPSGGDYYSFLHLALRNQKKHLKDILFADLSGEVFTQWAVDKNDPAVENVRWLDENADGFLFFVNAQNIAERRMAAVYDILDMAERLKESLRGRPVIAVWSKADHIQSVNVNHFQKIETEFERLFGQHPLYQISNYLDINSNPDPKSINNLTLLNDLLNKISAVIMPEIAIGASPTETDPFLTYRGHGK